MVFFERKKKTNVITYHIIQHSKYKCTSFVENARITASNLAQRKMERKECIYFSVYQSFNFYFHFYNKRGFNMEFSRNQKRIPRPRSMCSLNYIFTKNYMGKLAKWNDFDGTLHSRLSLFIWDSPLVAHQYT